MQDRPHFRIFRYAICADEPIVQFMMLYLILCDICENQSGVDRYVMEISPNTDQTQSPHSGRPETIYTKLRNEITHRTNISLELTRNEIINNISEFKRIVHRAIESHI